MALYHSARGSVDYTIVGSPTIIDGVASGFSGSDYLSINQQLDTSKPFEIVSKFKNTSIGGNVQSIIGIPTYSGLFQIYLNRTGKIKFGISTSAGSWNIADIEGRALSIDTDYVVKAVFTGTAYQLYLSLDNGVTWNLENSTSSTALVNNGTPITLQIGNSHRDIWYFHGSIDLNETYITVNGQPWFGICPIEVKKHQIMGPVGYTVVGSPTITDGVSSDFGGSSYLQTSQNLDFSKPFLIRIKFKKNQSDAAAVCCCGDDYSNRSFAVTVSSVIRAYFSTTGNSWTSNSQVLGSIDENKNYLLEIENVPGEKLIFRAKEETAQNWTSIEFAGSVYNSNCPFKIGMDIYNTSNYFKGVVDLNNTYIKVNGQLWFYQPQETKYIVRNGSLVWADPRLYLTGPVDYEEVGSPTITDGVASGFSDSNYLPISGYFTEEGDIDVILKITTDELTAQQYPFSWNCKPASAYRNCGLYIISGGKYGFIVRDTADNNYQYTAASTYALSANTTYYLRLLFTSADKSLKMGASTDGVNYTYGINITLTANLCPMNGDIIRIGRAIPSNNSFLGSIDLNNTYIKVNNELWFYGKNYASSNIAPVPSGFTYGTTTTSAIGYVDMRTQEFTTAPSGATISREVSEES